MKQRSGKAANTAVEGRKHYPVSVRDAREIRDDIQSIGRLLAPAPAAVQIPLEQLADSRYVRRPQVLKSKDTFLAGYVLVAMQAGNAEVDVGEDCQRVLNPKIASGELVAAAGRIVQICRQLRESGSIADENGVDLADRPVCDSHHSLLAISLAGNGWTGVQRVWRCLGRRLLQALDIWATLVS
jgi:hypothetical protein